jgi:hypothetical protein
LEFKPSHGTDPLAQYVHGCMLLQVLDLDIENAQQILASHYTSRKVPFFNQNVFDYLLFTTALQLGFFN